MKATYEIENSPAKISKNKIFYHVLFWGIFINYYGLLDNAFAIKYNINWLGYTFGVALFYVVSLWVMPQFYEKKRYINCAFAFLLLYFIYNLLMQLVLYAQTEGENFWTFIRPDTDNLLRSIIKNLYNFITYSTYGIIFWLFDYIKKQYKEKERIENENYTIEKDFLNSQINQHFLYNMLNLFYVNAYQYSENLAYDILAFSELLRYSLKDDNKELVPIENEIEVVKKMLHLFNNQLNTNMIGRLEVGDIPNDFNVPSNMLILIYQSLLTTPDKVDFYVTLSHANERLQIQINYIAQTHGKAVNFSVLKERLSSIYHTGYLFKETRSDKNFELSIEIPHISMIHP